MSHTASSIGEYLLYVISARQIMPWSAFRGAFDELVRDAAAVRELTPEQVRSLRNVAVRGLQALAHMELVEVGAELEVRVSPPVLARLPIAGLPQAVLTGWRSPSLLSKLNELTVGNAGGIKCSCELLEEELGVLPVRCLVTAETEQQLISIATGLDITPAIQPPAWTLAAAAPSLQEYLATLEWGHLRDLPTAAIRFDPVQLRFRQGDGGDSSTGLWAVQVPSGPGYIHILRLEGRQAFAHRDWARWAIASHVVGNKALYDESTFTLSVPAGLPLPPSIARAAALCCGRPGRLVTQATRIGDALSGAELGYQGVPPPLGRHLLAKLSLSHQH